MPRHLPLRGEGLRSFYSSCHSERQRRIFSSAFVGGDVHIVPRITHKSAVSANLLLEEKVLSTANRMRWKNNKLYDAGGGRMAPLCKGGCHDCGRDWGIVAVRRTAFKQAISATIPPSQLNAVPPPFTQGRL